MTAMREVQFNKDGATTGSITPKNKKKVGLLTPSKQSRLAPEPAVDGEAYKFLQSIEEFSQLPANELKHLAEYCRFATVESGQYICTEGDETSLYGFIVVTGRLAMMKTSISGKQLIVELLSARDIFGLLVTFSSDQLYSQLSARAQPKSRVLWVPIQKLTNVFYAYPKLYKELVTNLLRCLLSSYGLSRGLAHDKVEVRIATILVTLALKFARALPAPQDYTIDITRQQLADLTGTTTETAIRVTRDMQRSGLIDIKRAGVIRVIELERLQIISEDGL